MKITIEKDSDVSVDMFLCESVLNEICEAIEFKALPDPVPYAHSSQFIDISREVERVESLSSTQQSKMHFFLTRRPHDDNYFVHRTGKVEILSLANWEAFTSLPEENGFLHFIAHSLAIELAHLVHPEVKATGCVYDFHYYKSGVDRCMREGRICQECSKALQRILKDSQDKQPVYNDIVSILQTVSNTSRMACSVFAVLSDRHVKDLNWETFENLVADYYRHKGAIVEQDCNLAGFQADVLATETTGSGETLRTVVECKFHKAKIGNRVVNEFARVFATIREAGFADRAVMVSYSGFTQDARLVAQHSAVKLLHYKDIVQIRRDPKISHIKFNAEQIVEDLRRHKGSNDRRIFVIMPFSADMDDLYFFGIQGAVNECGAVCVRMDNDEFNGGILEQLYSNIERCDIIIADVSRPNPNVYYEVGYAHALRRQVVLITSDVGKAPFDLSGFNHIVYSTIRDLKEKLRKRLNALLK